MTREERDALRQAIDRERRARIDWSYVGADPDREPPHEGCTLHKLVILHRPEWSGCADDETAIDHSAAIMGAQLGARTLESGGGAPLPSRMFGRAA